jgi:hypothetical protein
MLRLLTGNGEELFYFSCISPRYLPIDRSTDDLSRSGTTRRPRPGKNETKRAQQLSGPFIHNLGLPSMITTVK